VTLLIDMNLSPRWIAFFQQEGFGAHHWSDIGDGDAPDEQIFSWAASQHAVVFTHDLDFGAILAATSATAPSVIQLRAQDVLPEATGSSVVRALHQFEDALQKGAIVTVQPEQSRVRMLPLRTDR